ncbi:MAG: hypothetical protein KDE04_24040, partial [Anaerolineales bacterium]|nr:hypothetical protein [Anaerolineales bacterium]
RKCRYWSIKFNCKGMVSMKEKQKINPAGIAIGIAIGVALGIAMDNLAIGIAIGVAVGAGIGVAMGQTTKKEEDD